MQSVTRGKRGSGWRRVRAWLGRGGVRNESIPLLVSLGQIDAPATHCARNHPLGLSPLHGVTTSDTLGLPLPT